MTELRFRLWGVGKRQQSVSILATLALAAGCARPAPTPDCAFLTARLALTTAELAGLEGDIRAQDQDAECDLACAAMERLRNEMKSEIREQWAGVKGCGVRDAR